MGPRLDLPPSPRRLVFRRIVLQLRNDPILKRLPLTVLAWEGRPDDGRDLTLAEAPIIRLTPSFGPDTWAFPDAMKGTMFIDTDIGLPGTDVGDMLDFWVAMMRALYPTAPGAALAFQKELRELGIPYCSSAAYTGLIEFSQPPADVQPGDGFMSARGQLKLDIFLNINS